jgi:hypothetical protein
VTAQVIQSDSTPLLYVIDCSSLAKKSSDHINAAYDAKLRLDKKRGAASEYFALVRRKKDLYRSTHTLGLPVYRDESSDDDTGYVDSPPTESYSQQEQELCPNYVVLNKRQTLRQLPAPTPPDYALCAELYARQSRKINKSQTLPMGTDNHSRPMFRPAPSKTAAESRMHSLAPSPQRVDDLKEPWVASTDHKDHRGAHMMRFDGARSALIDREREKSILASMSAVERVKREAEDRQMEMDAWKKQVVVTDTTFHVSVKAPHDKVISDLDRITSLLNDPPVKRSLVQCSVPAAPVSMYSHTEPPPKQRTGKTVTAHPESRLFYYPPPPQSLPALPKPLDDAEKRGPLWQKPSVPELYQNA